MRIPAGSLRAFYLFDVADTIDLRSLRTVGGEGLTPADLPLRPHTSAAYLQFPVPPLVARLSDAQLEGRTVQRRVKLFDYGVIAVRLTSSFEGEFEEFVTLSNELRKGDSLLRLAMQTANAIEEIAGALDDRHAPLVEDYYVARIEQFDQPVSAGVLMERNAGELAALILGEAGPFSQSETAEALRQRFSYYADDLTVVQWDSAVVYDRRESADAIEDILEFANSQLVELRTYDGLLDRELDAIYASKPGRTVRSLLGRRAAEQAASLRYLIVDVLELTDRASNALKVIGDAYYARIYRAASQRLALDDWQRQIDRKLASVGDMYRFASDEARAGRDEFLEIVIIVLIVIEVVLAALALHR